MIKKRSTSLRLSSDALALMQKLSKKLGIAQTDVVEIAVRKFAETELKYESLQNRDRSE